jgi:hypothetical protein
LICQARRLWNAAPSRREPQVTDKRTQEQADHGNMEKRPEDWTTGDVRGVEDR